MSEDRDNYMRFLRARDRGDLAEARRVIEAMRARAGYSIDAKHDAETAQELLDDTYRQYAARNLPIE